MRELKIINIQSLFFLLILICNILIALPRFAVTNGASCSACHINPAGSGLRNEHGTNVVAIDELPFDLWIKEVDDTWDGFITDQLQIGGDFRLQGIQLNDTDSTRKTSFFPMQADIYSYLSVHKNAGIYTKLGIMGKDDLQIEYWIILKNLISNSWLKIGRSLPNYGLRVDDHTSFIRGGNYNRTRQLNSEKEGLIFSVYNELPAMIEFGIPVYSNFEWTSSLSTSLINQNEEINNFTSKLFYRGSIIKNVPYNFSASYMKENIFSMVGVAGGISYKDLTYTFAADQAKNWIDNASSLAIYDQLVWETTQGIHIILKYDFFDPNIARQDGAITRYTIGTEFYPLNILEIKLQVRYSQIEPEVNMKKGPEYLIQTHLYF